MIFFILMWSVVPHGRIAVAMKPFCMKSKNGHIIPVSLTSAISKNKMANAIFQPMRPSCQQKYINRAKASAIIKRGLTTTSIMKSIHAYGIRHHADGQGRICEKNSTTAPAFKQ